MPEPRPPASDDSTAEAIDEVGATGDPSAGSGPHAGRFRFEGSLRVRAARGTLINSAFLVGLSGLGLLKRLVLAGFLTQADYAIWGILIASIGRLLMLKQVGINDKYIQQDDRDQELAFQRAFTLELFFSVAVVVVIAAFLPLIALAYGTPEIELSGLVLLAAFVVAPFQAPIWVFYRRMEFARQRALMAVDPIVSFGLSVVLAVAGAGYWAFVIGFTAGAAAAALAAVIFSPYRLRLRFDRATVSGYFGFSWPLFAASAAALVIGAGGLLAARWELGLEEVGAIVLAGSITMFTDRVGQLITGTLYPAICAVKDRTSLLFESFVKSNRLGLMWAIPFGVGLALFAADLVEFGIGERWDSAIIVLQVHGLVAAINQIAFNWTAYFRARGETRPIATASVAAMIAFVVIGLPLLYAFGLPGFAAAIAVQALAYLVVRGYYLSKLFQGFSYAAHAMRAILPTVPAVGAVLLLRLVETGERTLGVALGELGLYLLVTIIATWRYESTLLREAVGYLFKKAAPDRSAPSAGALGPDPA